MCRTWVWLSWPWEDWMKHTEAHHAWFRSILCAPCILMTIQCVTSVNLIKIKLWVLKYIGYNTYSLFYISFILFIGLGSLLYQLLLSTGCPQILTRVTCLEKKVGMAEKDSIIWYVYLHCTPCTVDYYIATGCNLLLIRLSGRQDSFLHLGTNTVISICPLLLNQSTHSLMPWQENSSLLPWLGKKEKKK